MNLIGSVWYSNLQTLIVHLPDDIDSAVKKLLELKVKYKELTGMGYAPPGGGGRGGGKGKKEESKQNKTPKKPEKQQQQKKQPEKVEKDDVSGVKKQTRLGMEVKKSENLSEWYSQV